MIRIEGEAKQAEYIEDKIKKNTIFLTVPFTVYTHDGGEGGVGLGKGFQSRCFTRDYEIIANKEQVMKVRNSSQRRIRDIILWLTSKEINLTFKYDYRIDRCEIFVSCDSWKRLLKLIPSLNADVRIIEPNRCEIVCEVA